MGIAIRKGSAIAVEFTFRLAYQRVGVAMFAHSVTIFSRDASPLRPCPPSIHWSSLVLDFASSVSDNTLPGEQEKQEKAKAKRQSG
jgi:hypothetical protein